MRPQGCRRLHRALNFSASRGLGWRAGFTAADCPAKPMIFLEASEPHDRSRRRGCHLRTATSFRPRILPFVSRRTVSVSQCSELTKEHSPAEILTDRTDRPHTSHTASSHPQHGPHAPSTLAPIFLRRRLPAGSLPSSHTVTPISRRCRNWWSVADDFLVGIAGIAISFSSCRAHGDSDARRRAMPGISTPRVKANGGLR